jgi:hypothetical protein
LEQDAMDREQLKAQWKAARDAGKFVTLKHDPVSLKTTWNSYRTVLTHEFADNLDDFIDGDKYDIDWCENPGAYYVLTPHVDSGFSVTASGVPPRAPVPAHACDRLVVVSGTKQGWHCFGETSAKIQQDLNAGTLQPKKRL